MLNQVQGYTAFLEPAEFAELLSYVTTLPLDQPTPVFSVAQSKNIIDSDIRKSLSVMVDDPNLLRFIEKALLDKLAREESLIVKLARDKVTFIKYYEGGHFDWHADRADMRYSNYTAYHTIIRLEKSLTYSCSITILLMQPADSSQCPMTRPAAVSICEKETFSVGTRCSSAIFMIDDIRSCNTAASVVLLISTLGMRTNICIKYQSNFLVVSF